MFARRSLSSSIYFIRSRSLAMSLFFSFPMWMCVDVYFTVYTTQSMRRIARTVHWNPPCVSMRVRTLQCVCVIQTQSVWSVWWRFACFSKVCYGCGHGIIDSHGFPPTHSSISFPPTLPCSMCAVYALCVYISFNIWIINVFSYDSYSFHLNRNQFADDSNIFTENSEDITLSEMTQILNEVLELNFSISMEKIIFNFIPIQNGPIEFSIFIYPNRIWLSIAIDRKLLNEGVPTFQYQIMYKFQIRIDNLKFRWVLFLSN